MSFFRYRTQGRLEPRKVGPWTYQVIFLDPSLEAEPPFAGATKLRFEGEIDDVPVKLAWQISDGRHFAMVSPALRKQLGLHEGDELTLRFNLASDDDVEVPEELASALARSAKHRKLWDALTPGAQRGFCYLVTSAKTAPTREKRAQQVLAELSAGGKPGSSKGRARR